jgi:hypothetical protein
MSKKLNTIVCCATVVWFANGCSSSNKNAYVPSEDAGKQALETALSAWKDGKSIGTIQLPGSAAVQPQDSDWKNGKKLLSFTIQNELPSAEGPRQFPVQLKFDGAPKAIDTVYFVVGRDPLWVFRDRDYQRAAGM